MHPDPLDRRPDGVDPESERWWAELMAEPPPPPAPPRRMRRRRTGGPPRASRTVAAFLGLLVAVFGLVAFMDRGRASFPVSYDDGHLDATTIQGAAGSYAFLSTQPGTEVPVTYPPCRSVQVRINPAGEVTGGSQLVIEAMARVSELSGLRLEYVGPSTDRPAQWSEAMGAAGMEGYPPALVSWSDEDETPDLEGKVVGLGGSISVRGAAYARARYMTGSVTLDGPDLATVLSGPDGKAQVRAVILHELGHLVGLGHVADPNQLMSETNYGLHDFGPGDREGLARLGSAGC